MCTFYFDYLSFKALNYFWLEYSVPLSIFDRKIMRPCKPATGCTSRNQVYILI